VLTYLILGAAGAPLFAGGAFGAAKLIGPTGGYMFGWIGTVLVTGYLVERGLGDRPWKMMLCMVAGELVMFAAGLAWLSRFVGVENVLLAGLIPFLPGQAIKVSMAAMCQPMGRRSCRSC